MNHTDNPHARVLPVSAPPGSGPQCGLTCVPTQSVGTKPRDTAAVQSRTVIRVDRAFRSPVLSYSVFVFAVSLCLCGSRNAPAAEPADARAQAWASHWAFQPVVAPPLPAVQERDWPRTAMDRFVLAKLEQKGLHPSPAADRRTLLRRVTFDLTGLPPTPEEVAAFEADRSPEAFARVVDRLLASPHYGERWGRYWLDVARYADTKGYVFAEDIGVPLGVHLPRLRHPLLQRRPALRPVRARAARRRPAAARQGPAGPRGPGLRDPRRPLPEQ